MIEQFFNEFRNFRQIRQNNTKLIINIDETVIQIGKDKTKVLCFNEEPPPTRTIPPLLEHITIVFAITAWGEYITPLVILPLKTLPDLSNDISENYDITGSDKGWITGEILKNWLENQFAIRLQELRKKHHLYEPALVIMDNHASRSSIDQIKMWNLHQVEFIFIPAHTSHLLQPLDRCPNNEFKKLLKKNFVYKSKEDTSEKRIRILDAAIPSYQTALSGHYARAGWREAGLEPLNISKVIFQGSVDINAPINYAPPEKKRKRGPRFNNQVFTNGKILCVGEPELIIHSINHH